MDARSLGKVIKMSKIYLEVFHFQARRDTAKNWNTSNPILCDGEFGIVTDSVDENWLKVGDGATPWELLPFKKGPKGNKGDKGDPFVYSDFTDEQLALLKGAKGDTGNTGPRGLQGEKGDTGATGATGAKGDKGDKGDAFTYEDFTAEQLAELKGAKGDKGDKGDTGEVTKEQMNAAIAAEVSAEKNRANNAFGNALKGAVSGSAVRMDDVSPVEHTLGVKVGSKNSFDISSSVGFQSYYSGVTSTISGTTITTSSTANRSCNLLLGNFSAGTYTISFSNTDFSLLMLQYGETLEKLSRLDSVNFKSTKSHTFTLTQPVKLWLESTISTNQTRTITDIQLESGSTVTPYTPFISDFSTVTVTRCGKNLLDPSLYHNTATSRGITYTTNGDTITLTGTATASSYVNVFSSNPDAAIPLPSILQNKKIKLYAYGNSKTVEFLIRKTTSTTVSANTNQAIDTTGATGFSIRCRFTSGNTYNDSVKFMINEEGVENNPAYEPYKTPTEYTPAADGTVSGVKSLYPTTTLITDTEGVIIEAEYNRDINKAFAEMQQAILSLGGNV